MGGDDDDKPRPSPEMNKRMGAVLKAVGNDVCADCPAKRPLWVSFLAGRVEKDRKMGVMICTKCAQYHHFELGEKRCLIKYLKMAHEFSMADIVILENSGNIHVNGIFEAKLTEDEFDKEHVESDDEEEQKRRSKFIKNKYKKCKYQDEVAYYQQMLALVNPEPEPEPEPEPAPTDADIRRDLRMANRHHRDAALRTTNFNRSTSHDDVDIRARTRDGPGLRRTKSGEYSGRPGGGRDREDHHYHRRPNRHDKDMRSSSAHRDRRDRRDRDGMSSSDHRERERGRPSSKEKDKRKDFTRAKSTSFDKTKGSVDRDNRRPGLSKAKSSFGLDGSDKGDHGSRNRRTGLSKANSSFGLGGDRRGDLRGGRRPQADKDRKSDFRSSAPAKRPSLSDLQAGSLLDGSSSKDADNGSSEFKHGRRMGLAADKDRKGAFRASAPTRLSDTDLESLGKPSSKKSMTEEEVDALLDESSSHDNDNASSEFKHGRRMGLAGDKDRNSAFRSSAPTRGSDNNVASLNKSVPNLRLTDSPSSNPKHVRRDGLIKAKSSFGLDGSDKDNHGARDRRKGMSKAKSSFGLGGNRRGDLRGGRKSPADKDRKSDFRSSAPERPSLSDKEIDALLLDDSSGKNNGADKDRSSSLRSSAPELISEADILGTSASEQQVEKNETTDDAAKSSKNSNEEDKPERRDSDASLGEAADALMPMPTSRSRSFNLGQSTSSSLSIDPQELAQRKARCKSLNASDSKLGEFLSDIASERKSVGRVDSFGFPTSFAEGDNKSTDNESSDPQEKPDVSGEEKPPTDGSSPENLSPDQQSPENGVSEEKGPSLSDLGYESTDGENLGGKMALRSSFHGSVATPAPKEETIRSKSMDLRPSNQDKPTGKPEPSDKRSQMHKSRSARRTKKQPERKRSLGNQLERSQTLPVNEAPNTAGSDKKIGRRTRSFSPAPNPGDSPANSPTRRRPRKQLSSRRVAKQKSSEETSDELKVEGAASTEEEATPEKSTNESKVDPEAMNQTSVPKSSPRKPVSLHESIQIGDLKDLLDESVASNDPMWANDKEKEKDEKDSQQRRLMHGSAPTLGIISESGDNAKPKRTPRNRRKKTSSPDAAAPSAATDEVDKSSTHSSKKSSSRRKSPRRQRSMEGVPKSPGKKKETLGGLLGRDAEKKAEDGENRGSPKGGRKGLVRSLSHESLLEKNDEPNGTISRSLHSLLDVDSSKISDALEGDNTKSPGNKRRPGVGARKKKLVRTLSHESLLVDKDQEKEKETKKPKDREKRNLHKSFAIGDSSGTKSKNKSKRNLHASFAVNDRSKRNLGSLDNLPNTRKARGGPKKKLVRSLSHESLLDKKEEQKDDVSRNLKSLL